MKSSALNKIIFTVTNEWQKKLVSLILATLLWYYINSLAYVEQTFNLPIQFRNMPTDMVIVEMSDTSVPILAKGKIERVKNMNLAKNIQPSVDLEQAIPGDNFYKIDVSMNDPEPDVTVTPVKEKVRLKIDRMVNKTLLVQGIASGVPKSGYVLDDIIIDRRLVTIRGPSGLLATINYVETQPMSVDGATNDVIRDMPLNLPRLVSVSDTNLITVHARIVKKDKRGITD